MAVQKEPQPSIRQQHDVATGSQRRVQSGEAELMNQVPVFMDTISYDPQDLLLFVTIIIFMDRSTTSRVQQEATCQAKSP